MPHLSKLRIFLGWVKEFLYLLLIPLHFLPGLFFRYRGRAGDHETTFIIVADLFCQPLYYSHLRRALLKSGFSVIVAKTGSAFSSLHDHARNLSRLLADYDVEKGVLIGHGMGSLVALALPDAGRQRIEHLVSVGTPFHGSRLFLYGAFIPAIRDMAVGSNFLLFNRMNALLFSSFTPFIAWQDEWIVPFNLAHFGQGRDLIFDQVGHFNLVRSKENVQVLADHLQEIYAPELFAARQRQAAEAALASEAKAESGAAERSATGEATKSPAPVSQAGQPLPTQTARPASPAKKSKAKPAPRKKAPAKKKAAAKKPARGAKKKARR